MSMARTTVVKKAQKHHGKCQKCGKELPIGCSYKWVAPRAHKAARGFKKKRCMGCPGWRPSELTSSQHLGTIYAAQETFDDFVSSWEGDDGCADGLGEAGKEAASSIEEAAESYRESAQNIEEGFGHPTQMSEELEEKASEVESWAGEVESAADDVEDLDKETIEDDARTEWEDDEALQVESLESYTAGAIDNALGEWMEEQQQKIEDVLGECPV